MAYITRVYEQQTRSARYTHITNISRLDHAVAVIRWTLTFKHSCMHMWLTLNRLVLFLSQNSPCAGMCFSCCHGTLLPSNTSRAHCRFCENTNIFSQRCMQESVWWLELSEVGPDHFTRTHTHSWWNTRVLLNSADILFLKNSRQYVKEYAVGKDRHLN